MHSELEGYFRAFPDVPREVVLKIELLSRGQWFTDAALAATKGSLVKSYRLFSYDLVPMDSAGPVSRVFGHCTPCSA